MVTKQRKTLQEAIAMIHDGDSIALGGWTVSRTPVAACYEMIRQGKKDLRIACGATGSCTDLLVAAGCISISEAAWFGHEGAGPGYSFQRAVERNDGSFIQSDETTTTVYLRLLAAAMNVPFLPSHCYKGSDIINPEYDTLRELRGKDPKIAKKKCVEMKDPFWEGHTVNLIPAARPDVSIIHVQEIGEGGTIRTQGPLFGDLLVAAAGKLTIVTAEKIVSEVYLRQNTALNTIPGEFVDVIAEVPYGAHPGCCYGYHDVDKAFFKEMVAAEKEEDTFREWMKKWVLDVGDHDGYLQALGDTYLKPIGVDPAYGYNPEL